MADRYIDLDERLVYGAMTARRLRTYVTALPADAKDGAVIKTTLELMASNVEGATTALASLLSEKRGAKARVHDTSTAKEPVKTEARRLLGALASHLDELSKTGAQLDRNAFFRNGRVSDLGDSVTALLGGVALALSGCRAYEAALPSLVERRTKLEDLAGRLALAVEDSANAHGDSRAATPEVQAASRAWDTAYDAAKSVTRGLLMLRGEIGQLAHLFHDLAVAANAHVKADPGDT